MTSDALAQIARTVLYEGYVLWPYRRSALKNRQRWTFGGVYPPAFAASSGGADRSVVRAECLIEARPGACVNVSVRFLHVVRRQAVRLDGDVRVPVDELHVGADRHLSWDEATEREVRASVALGAGTVVVPIEIAAGEVTESLGAAGLVVRSWERIDATLTVETTPAGDAFRLSVAVGNTSDPRVTERDGAVRHTLASAHVVLRSDEGTFVSLLDPPPALADETARCRNEGLWPVLVGEDGSRDTMLAAPIILYDYPRVAPESPGDFFDGGEIDQLLVLNVLSLTDEERREMRDSDPRAREILERCNALSEEELMRLHGVVRAMRLCTPTQECPDA